jgi:hypothetical protein
MTEIVHLTVSPDRDSFSAHMADGAWVVYWFEESLGCPVRQRRWIAGKEAHFGAKEPLINRWEELLAKADAHPMNWLNKLAPRMMQLYAEKKASKQLETEEAHA